MKVNLISLGCPKNLVDSEKLLGSLGAAGIEICTMPEYSDIIIINTCAFIEPAINETEEVINNILTQTKNSRVYVYGCAVNRYEKRLKKAFPSVTGFFSLEQYDEFLKIIHKQAINTRSRLLTTQGYAYLKIADGCSNHCSYCTIPSIKGPLKSNSIDELYEEAKELAAYGVKELILIAQDTTAYGKDLYNKPMLSILIRRLSDIESIKWIRIMYSNPKSLNDGMINEISMNDKICKYLDLPIQHISDRILKLMNRGVTKKQIHNQFMKLKQVKGISLRTTVIVGFPSETDIEFKELVNFIEEIDIDWLGVFPYYCETGTQAAGFDQLPEYIIEKRYQELLKLQHKIIQMTNTKKIGETHKTLIHQKNTQYKGHTQYACPEIDSNVLINTDDLMLGEFCSAHFTGLSGCDINAEVMR
ncbi:MAG: 30S ribosomal protein S12 methylthiotransferase RimO [bacterium]